MAGLLLMYILLLAYYSAYCMIMIIDLLYEDTSNNNDESVPQHGQAQGINAPITGIGKGSGWQGAASTP